MGIQKAQQEVDNWIKEHGVRYFNELTNMAQLPRRSVRWLGLSPVGMASKVKKNRTRTRT